MKRNTRISRYRVLSATSTHLLVQAVIGYYSGTKSPFFSAQGEYSFMSDQPSESNAESIFQHALNLPETQRQSYLETACGNDAALMKQVKSLLYHAAIAQTQDLLGAAGLTVQTARTEPSQPQQVGPYKIVSLLGEGGMGTVYLVEQQRPLRRSAALKLIKPGFDTREVLARFDAERQVLAQLDHPNIAKVLDAGVTEAQRPYFVLEYVPGKPVTRFCDEHRLSIPDRLLLFIQICEAISHAHTKAIIHRDIKASNVLAYLRDGKPAVKVIDFGIAKALSGRLGDLTVHTGPGLAIGTYESMSPEQADGSPDIDTRTDVYSLGVLLYELIAGSTPFDRESLKRAGDQELRRIIREVDAPRPSTRLTALPSEDGTRIATSRDTELQRLARQLRRELEWIPLKAMRKERQRRYESVADFADDIRCYLDGKPLRAGPETRSYRAAKFIRRHRGALSAAATITLLVAAGIIFYVHSLRTERNRTLAALHDVQTQKQISDETLEYLTGMFQAADPDQAQGKTVTAVEVVHQAVERLKSQTTLDPAARVRLSYELGKVLQDLGAVSESEPIQHDAMLRSRELFGDNDPRTMAVTSVYATVLAALGNPAKAEPILRDVLDRRRRISGDGDIETMRVARNLAGVVQMLGRYAEAETLFRQTMELSRRKLGNDDPETIVAVGDYAFVLESLGRAPEAEPLYREVLDSTRKRLGDDHPQTIEAINKYAMILNTLGRYATSELLYKEALDRRRRVLGEEHPLTIIAMNNYASVLINEGRFDEAEAIGRDAMERARRIMGPDHPSTLTCCNVYTQALRGLGRNADSLPILQDVLERRRRVQGPDHPDTLTSVNNYAAALRALGRPAEAEPLLKDVLDRRRRIQGPDHPSTLTSLSQYAQVLGELGRKDEAEPLYRQVMEARRRVLGEDHPDTRNAINNYGFILLTMNRPADAAPYLRDAMERAQRIRGPDHMETMLAMGNYANALAMQGKLAEAEPLAKRVLEQTRKVRGENHQATLGAMGNYGSLLQKLGRAAEAEPLLRHAAETALASRSLGPKHPETRKFVGLYVSCLDVQGKHEEAAKWRERIPATQPSSRPSTAPSTRP
jgi:non-specific serine/threonine protein kinase/serine/threonine-protein kinase